LRSLGPAASSNYRAMLSADGWNSWLLGINRTPSDLSWSFVSSSIIMTDASAQRPGQFWWARGLRHWAPSTIDRRGHACRACYSTAHPSRQSPGVVKSRKTLALHRPADYRPRRHPRAGPRDRRSPPRPRPPRGRVGSCGGAANGGIGPALGGASSTRSATARARRAAGTGSSTGALRPSGKQHGEFVVGSGRSMASGDYALRARAWTAGAVKLALSSAAR
jgi:hypothetical protein